MTLTVGYQQFSRNMRYRVARVHNSENHRMSASASNQQNEINNNNNHHQHKLNRNLESWNFEIRKVSHEDQGLYECYVKLNSKHKLKANINLIVKDEKERVHKSKSHDSHSVYSHNCNFVFFNDKFFITHK